MGRVRLAFLCLALCLPAAALAQDGEKPGQAPISPLTTRAAQEFSQGNKDAACADAQAALRQNPADDKALGISKMTCGEKPISRMEYQKRPSRPDLAETNIVPKKPSGAQANPDRSAPSGEAVPAQVVSAGPAGPGIREEPTTYDKLMEAQSLLTQGRPAEAAAAARRAVELQPRNRRAYDALAAAYRQLRSYKQVIYVADLGLKTFPNDADLLQNKIFALNKEKDFKAALKAADQALAVYATDPLLHALRAFALGRSGDREGMRQALGIAAALDPSFEPLLREAQKAPPDGEPFLMPGDAREPTQKAARLKTEGPQLQGLIIFGGLIVLLLVILGLLGTGLMSQGPGEAPPEDQA